MFYATRCLHLPQCEPLEMYVVEVTGGVVVRWMPFDGERASMLWAEELFVSQRAVAESLDDIKNEAAPQGGQPLYLYSFAGEDERSLVRLQ